MKIEVNITKKYFFGVMTLMFLIAGGIFVYAFGTNDPANFGHSIGEVAAPAGCSAGQVLSWSGSAWSCSSVSSSGSSYSTLLNWSSSGSYIWTVPSGVNQIRVRAWGGGGGAGTYYNTGHGCCGDTGDGKDGGYAESILSVIPGQRYRVVVGNAGTSSSSGGSDGGNSSLALIPNGMIGIDSYKVVAVGGKSYGNSGVEGSSGIGDLIILGKGSEGGIGGVLGIGGATSYPLAKQGLVAIEF